MSQVDSLLKLSALGIYVHGFFVSITLGLPLVVAFLLYKYSKTGDETYFKAVKIATAVLAVNFALGAVTGTLVEFGLIQIWPGTIIAIATSALAPLALELIAFVMEIAFLILFVVTLGRISTRKSIAIILAYWAFALLSGALITGVNSWLIAPWGTGGLASVIYPFMPEYGPESIDLGKLLIVKVLLLASDKPLQEIIQRPEVAEKIGLLIEDPYVAFKSPYAWASIIHNLIAAVLVGSSIALAVWAYRYYKTGDEKKLKIIATFMAPILLLLLIQATVSAHYMGAMVVEYNPTKFAMMERAKETYYNPIIGIIAYGDPNHPIEGFDKFREKCEALGDITLGELATKLGISKRDVENIATNIGLELDGSKIDAVLTTKAKDVCLADLEKAERLINIVNVAYYTKLLGAGIAIVSSLLMTGILYDVPVLSGISRSIANRAGSRATVLTLGILVALGVIVAASLGWYVREVGRKPWTVYGLLYPEEIMTTVNYAYSAPFLAFASIMIIVISISGITIIALVASRYDKIEESLKKVLEKLSR
ncbi:MAG: cytochrome ubiquinol oxidase subunit I [Acidilobaceae archaeon]